MSQRTIANRRPPKSTQRLMHLLVVFAFSILLSPAVYAELPDGIEVSLKPVEFEFTVKQKVLIEVAYTNVTNKDIRMLTWGTALEKRIEEDILAISFDGEELPYMGRHIKRAPAIDSDYVVIAANQSISRKIDVLTGYDLDFKGEYQISLRDQGYISGAKTIPLKIKLLSDRLIAYNRTPIVTGCPDGKANLPNNRFVLIDAAVSSAQAIARVATDDLRNTPISKRSSAQRYARWFGSYSATRWNIVQTRFDKIYQAVRDQTITFDCEDDENYFAAVFPSQPYRIFLGRAFWSAPRTGTDSKSGTIVHELSHFNVLGVSNNGTDDFAYGQTNARNLAINDPNRAVSNADSLEYFAENTPFYSMPQPVFPDLIISSVALSTADVTAADAVTVSGLVKNNGDGESLATDAMLKITMSGSSAQTSSMPIIALKAEQSVGFEFDFSAPEIPGTYALQVCVTAVTDESNTNNNCSALSSLIVAEKKSIISAILLLLLGD